MIAFIEEHREVYGVEPICRVLPIAPSTCHAHAAVARNPGKASDRSRRDAETVETIKRVHDQSRGRCGVRKVWRQLRREKSAVARCTVERLMRDQGLQGVSRGRKKTAVPDPARPCPEDKVKRTFKADAPDKLWVADFTYAQTAMAMVYAAFIVDVFARKIVGWRVSTSMTTNFVLDALNQAICSRRPAPSGLIHHSDRGMQYLSFRCTERLAEAGIDPSVGSVGDSCDNALAETVIGLFKTEVVKHLGPWKTIGQLEWETMKWVHWHNKDRLHGAIGYLTPNEMEHAFRQQQNELEKAA